MIRKPEISPKVTGTPSSGDEVPIRPGVMNRSFSSGLCKLVEGPDSAGNLMLSGIGIFVIFYRVDLDHHVHRRAAGRSHGGISDLKKNGFQIQLFQMKLLLVRAGIQWAALEQVDYKISSASMLTVYSMSTGFW